MSASRGNSPLAWILLGCGAISAACYACAADPEKDPRGWGDVRFGMTQEQVLEALKDSARIVQVDKQADPPLMLSRGVPDLGKAVLVAKQIVDAADQGGRENDAKTTSARQLIKLIKDRSWSQYKSRPPEGRGGRKPPISQRVSGTLKEFVDYGALPKALRVQLSRKSLGVAELSISLLDENSQEYVLKVEQAIGELSGHLEAEAGPSPTAIKIDPVKVRGILLLPSVNFADGVVAGISLATMGSDNPQTPQNPNRHANHRTLCDALEEKFGAADENSSAGKVTRAVWRFPQTVITCCVHPFGHEIRYEPPSEENASGVDNL